jgi:hypothetical protein
MNITAPKIIASIIGAIWGLTLATGVPRALSEPPSPVPVARDYIIEPTTTTTEPIMVIDPYASPAAQFATLGVNLGWPVEQYNKLTKIIERESHGIPQSWNRTDVMSGSYGLLQINGFWCKGKTSYLQGLGVVNNCKSLLDPETNLRAGLIIWNRSGWNPWSTK